MGFNAMDLSREIPHADAEHSQDEAAISDASALVAIASTSGEAFPIEVSEEFAT
jgi:hypothetical protein